MSARAGNGARGTLSVRVGGHVNLNGLRSHQRINDKHGAHFAADQWKRSRDIDAGAGGGERGAGGDDDHLKRR